MNGNVSVIIKGVVLSIQEQFSGHESFTLICPYTEEKKKKERKTVSNNTRPYLHSKCFSSLINIRYNSHLSSTSFRIENLLSTMHFFGLSVSVAISLSSLLVQSVAGITIGRVNNEPGVDALLDVEGGSQPRLLNTVFRKYQGSWGSENPTIYEISSQCLPLPILHFLSY